MSDILSYFEKKRKYNVNYDPKVSPMDRSGAPGPLPVLFNPQEGDRGITTRPYPLGGKQPDWAVALVVYENGGWKRLEFLSKGFASYAAARIEMRRVGHARKLKAVPE